MNSSGTSLMPAVTPRAAPFQRRRSGWHMSHTMTAIITSSTWPRYRARCTGSVQKASPVTSSVAPARAGRDRQPSSRKAIHTVAASPNVPATVTSPISAGNGTARPAANSSAANGV